MTSPRSRLVPAGGADPQSAGAVPTLACDPMASFAPVAIEVDFLDRTWTVPAMTAQQWLEIIWSGPLNTDQIFPGLCGADEAAFEGLLEGKVEIGDLFAIATEILEIASGFKWWVALNLAMIAKGAWANIGGSVVTAVDGTRESLGAWLVAVLGVCRERVESREGLIELINGLNTPPPGYEEIGLDEKTEGAAFLAMMQQSL
jgi:hypothetical protein